MKYKIILHFIIIQLSFSLNAQKWDQFIGFPNINDGMLDVLECYDMGYLISGGTDMYEGIWILKTDINGEILWDKVINHNKYTLAVGNIDQNSSGEIAITSFLNYPNGDQWPTLVKLDSCGNKLWCRIYIDDEFSHGWFEDVILLDNGDILALGYLFTDANYNERIFLYYIDTNGTLVWRKSYASKLNHPLVLERIPDRIHQLNGEYIINGWCAYPYPGNPATGYMRPFYINIDSNFNEKWILPFGVNDSIIGKANNVISLNDSVYMGVGYKWQSTNPNSILMFFTSEGEELGYNQIYNYDINPDIKDNISNEIVRLDDTLFITSIFIAHEDGSSENGEFIIDSAANIYKFEQRHNTSGSKLTKTNDSKYIIGSNYKHPNSDWDIYLYKINDSLEMDTVYPGNYVYDSLCPYQIESGIIDITDCLLITDVGETPTPQEYFTSLNSIPVKAYPNPVKEGEITFELQNTEHHQNIELRCFNVFGKEVHLERVYQFQGETRINIQQWKQGVFVALVYSNGKIVGQCKFVVQ